jgi:hypothetical protein
MRVSGEGVVRLDLEELLSVPLQHCFSGLDDSCADRIEACGRVAVISGYTEWVSAASPPVSLGWDWQLDVALEGARWQRTNLPRTNVQLVDSRGRDLPWPQSLGCLSTVVDSLPWTDAVAESVGASIV